MVRQCTKFEVSRFTRYEAVNGGAKCRKWGGLGVFRGHSRSWSMPPLDRVHTTDFLFDFNRNYVSIFYRFRDITGYLSKVADFDPPHLHLAPPYRVTPVEFRGNLWHQKTRVPGVSCGVVCVIHVLCYASIDYNQPILITFNVTGKVKNRKKLQYFFVAYPCDNHLCILHVPFCNSIGLRLTSQ